MSEAKRGQALLFDALTPGSTRRGAYECDFELPVAHLRVPEWSDRPRCRAGCKQLGHLTDEAASSVVVAGAV